MNEHLLLCKKKFKYKYRVGQLIVEESLQNRFSTAFGTSVAISGDGTFCVISANNSQGEKYSCGGAALFEKQNGLWVWKQNLDPTDLAAYDYYGSQVAISQDNSTIVVGSPLDDDRGVESGSVYVWRKSGNVWVQVSKIIPPSTLADGNFGISVAISGNGKILFVGASKETNNAGAAYIYYNSSGNTFSYQRRLQGPRDQQYNWERYGHNVQISPDGTVGVIAAPFYGTESGMIDIFTFTNTLGSWTHAQRIVQPLFAQQGYSSNEVLGSYTAVSNNGQFVAITSSQEDGPLKNSGAVYIYKRVGNQWVQTQRLSTDKPLENEALGLFCKFNNTGSRLFVSGTRSQSGSRNIGAGAVFMYELQEDGMFKLSSRIDPEYNNTQNGDYFGFSIGIDAEGDSIIIGAPNAYNGANQGLAYQYDI